MTYRPLPDEHESLTHKATIGTLDVYITLGLYQDGELGSVLVSMGKEGSELRLLSAVADGITIGIQHGVPLIVYVEQYKYHQMGTGGTTSDQEIPLVKSVLDYLAKLLERKFIKAKPSI